MKFGWMTLSLSPSAADDLTCVHQQLEQGVLAETMGFDYLWLTEHNFTGECAYADPIPFAGALAARTSRARLGFAVIQMALGAPTWPPNSQALGAPRGTRGAPGCCHEEATPCRA